MSQTVRITGLSSLISKMSKLNKNASNLKRPFEKSAKPIISEFKSNFGKKGKVLNSPWKKRKHPKPWSMLTKTGKLKGTWKSKAKKSSLEIENPVEYAGFQHFGTKHINSRKIVGTNKKINEKILIKNLTNYILKPFRA